jgi:dienelactone hydrolase
MTRRAPPSIRARPLTRRRLLQAGAACLGAALAWPARAQTAHETIDLDWHDGVRGRSVPARLYRPRDGGALPLVVFSHGIGGSRFGYSYLGRHFAGHGVASLHLQHVGSDRSLWGGNVFDLVGRLQAAAQDGEALARVHDLRFALDRLLGDVAGARIDPGRIVAAGHSYGANTALLASGARVTRDGRAVALRDTRVKATIAISAPPFYGEDDLDRILGPVTLPSLHVTATEDVIRIPGFWSGADDRVEIFEAVGSARKWLAVFDGGSHGIFTDRRGTGGPVLNAQVKGATRELALAFVRAVFNGDEAALSDWPRRHRDIVARFVHA